MNHRTSSTPALVALARKTPEIAARAKEVITEHRGNLTAAAKALGTTKRSLWHALELLHLLTWLEQSFPARKAGGAALRPR